MNNDEENEENNEFDQQMEEEPKKENQVKGKAKDEAKRKVKQTIKKALNQAIKAMFKAFMALPLPIKLIIIVLLVIFILTVVLLILNNNSFSTAEKGVINIASDAGRVTNDIAGATGKSNSEKVQIFKEKSSLLLFSITDIENMYNEFLSLYNETNVSVDKVTIKNLQKVFNGGDLSSNGNNNAYVWTHDGVIPVLARDSRQLYKHILMTEKYNFNNINWREYPREGGKKIKNEYGEEETIPLYFVPCLENENNKYCMELQVDKVTGLQYPLAANINSIASIALPYLQSWYIPLSMYASSFNTMDTTQDKESKKNTDFVYQIIANAYTDLHINQYNIDRYEEVYEYFEYNEKPCSMSGKYAGEEAVKVQEELDGDENTPKTRKIYSYAGAIESCSDPGPLIKTEEVLVATNTHTDYEFRVMKVQAFDIYLLNKYYVTRYDSADDWHDHPMSESIGKQDLPDIDNRPETISKYASSVSWTNIVNYKRYQINRNWWDILETTSSLRRYYTINDIRNFIKNGGRNIENAFIEASSNENEFNSEEVIMSTKALKEYNYLEKGNRIDRITFINSYPEIYDKYLYNETDKNIGYTKEYLSWGYDNLKKSFSSIPSFPYVYGHSLNIKGKNTDKKILNNIENIPEGGFSWPLEIKSEQDKSINAIYGYSSYYGNIPHKGIDLGYIIGTNSIGLQYGPNIYSISPGKVIAADNSINRDKVSSDNSGMGNYIKIQYENFTVIYMHMSKVEVSVGDEIEQGQYLGVMGTTGNSNGVHLHLQIEYDGKTIDPLKEIYETDPVYGTFIRDEITTVGFYKYKSSIGGKITKDDNQEEYNELDEQEVQKLLNKLRNSNYEYSATLANKGLYTIEMDKDNNAKLLARLITEELGIGSDNEVSKLKDLGWDVNDESDEPGLVAAATAHLIHAVDRAKPKNDKNAVYKMYLDSGYMYTISENNVDDFNKEPPKWIVDLAEKAIAGNLSLPDGLNDVTSFYNWQTLSTYDANARFNSEDTYKLKQVVAFTYKNYARTPGIFMLGVTDTNDSTSNRIMYKAPTYEEVTEGTYLKDFDNVCRDYNTGVPCYVYLTGTKLNDYTYVPK